MIVLVIAALVVGLAAGAVLDALLRGRDPRSVAVVIAGAVGAVAGLFVRGTFGPDGEVLLPLLVALFGGLLAAFVLRARISTA